jgi:exopolysaccharide biosynthesis protein
LLLGVDNNGGGAGALRGFGNFNLDLAVTKNIHIRESIGATLNFQFINVLRPADILPGVERIHMIAKASIAPILALLALGCPAALPGAEVVEHPFVGVTYITRTETAPRSIAAHLVKIDLTSPGIRFKLTPPGGALETVRETTLGFLNREHAQVAINGHFFTPFPSSSLDANLVGFAASEGAVYSAFETPAQSYAIVANAPAINIDAANHAAIVHANTRFADGKHILENATVWNAVSGSAQIITNGVKTIPVYTDAAHPNGALTVGGPRHYSNSQSWYDALQARSAMGLSEDNRTLVLFTVDRAARSLGMTVGEVADMLLRDYAVYNALNLDGGGSTTLAIENPATHTGAVSNVSSDNPGGRSVGSNLAVFAATPEQAGTPQNPSPMVEHTRAHPRLQAETPQGRREKLALGELFLPAKLKLKSPTPLLVFFHGPAWIPEVAAARDGRMAVVAIQIGSGSQVYARAFRNPKFFGALLQEAEAKAGVTFAPITLAAWSAGCGAIRQILSTPESYDRVANVILIDGIHTGYAGGKPGPLESQIEPDNLRIFIQLARDAVAGKKRVIITHSEIFPGTFASTTETADYILKALGLRRRAVVQWGPMRTQELSEARAGRLLLVGFAGNSAPDHVDQLHSLPEYLKWLKITP